ncbi:MAG TPA: GNAT family N-acetyltransferase [Candidatus Acidoferrales bacterium]|nr:GNAT family N-acetyltransferase [Candidatus Acidoferrales bacterium]
MDEILQIRRAHPEESGFLTDLAMRSKAHWPYDRAFLEDVRPDLTLRPEKFMPDFHVYILEAAGTPVGFCSLVPLDRETVELDDLFIEPDCIGKGYGQRLWNYAVNLARELGFARIVLVSDPYAEPFYARQGAVRIGEKTSSLRAGRVLPVMEYELAR